MTTFTVNSSGLAHRKLDFKLIASAGRQQTCLPSWRNKSSARVYARCFFRDFMGLKGKNFLGHFWLGIFIQDNLSVNLKQEV